MRILYDIIWETDGEEVEGLPDEVAIPDYVEEDEECNYASDQYGWLIQSSYVKEV